MKRIARLGAIAVMLITAIPIAARSQSALPAGAGRLTACTVTSPGFTVVYDPLAAATTESVTSVKITCSSVTQAIPLVAVLSAGNSGTFAGRVLVGGVTGSGRIAYNLYDEQSGKVFGDGTGATATYQTVLAASGSTVSATFGLEFLAPPHQLVPVGAYSDTLTVGLNF